MEIVIGPRGRRGIMRGVVQSPVGGPQRGDLLVVERRRLPRAATLSRISSDGMSSRSSPGSSTSAWRRYPAISSMSGSRAPPTPPESAKARGTASPQLVTAVHSISTRSSGRTSPPTISSVLGGYVALGYSRAKVASRARK